MSKHLKKRTDKGDLKAANARPHVAPKKRWLSTTLLVLGVLFGIAYIYSSFNRPVNTRGNLKNIKTTTSTPTEPQFSKEGELSFIGADTSEKKKINIEVADNARETEMGLMFRKKMEENQGMLFAFPDMQERSFWMKNTIIPLDIIYVGEDYKIVSIAKNTVPYSEKPVLSNALAKFVVEVNAGFTDKFDVKVGDRIAF